MICTVTFNPSLDYIIEADGFTPGRTCRTSYERLFPGGKGLNVSIVLQNLGYPSTALGFLAGAVGDAFLELTEELGISSDFLKVRDGFTRINIKFRSLEATEINGRGPRIRPEEANAFLSRLSPLGQDDILVLAGSLPEGLPASIYADICRQMASQNVLTVLDTSGAQLTAALPFHPFLIKPNLQELEEIFSLPQDYFLCKEAQHDSPDKEAQHDSPGKNMQHDFPGKNVRNDFPGKSLPPVPACDLAFDRLLLYAEKLQKAGARNVMLSMGGRGAALLARDGSFSYLPAPKGEVRSTVGAGDSMVAGFLAGWQKSGDYQAAFRLAAAAGSASAFCEHLPSKEAILQVQKSLSETITLRQPAE